MNLHKIEFHTANSSLWKWVKKHKSLMFNVSLKKLKGAQGPGVYLSMNNKLALLLEEIIKNDPDRINKLVQLHLIFSEFFKQ